jgi:quercetin dioxygenase-like cupin family protein
LDEIALRFRPKSSGSSVLANAPRLAGEMPSEMRSSRQGRPSPVRVKFPPGAHSNPHFHSQDRHATVIKGVWWNGVGEELDFNKAVAMQTGSYVLHPAGAVHWDGAGDEEAIVQIIGIGPVETVPLGPAGAPTGYWPKPK